MIQEQDQIKCMIIDHKKDGAISKQEIVVVNFPEEVLGGVFAQEPKLFQTLKTS